MKKAFILLCCIFLTGFLMAQSPRSPNRKPVFDSVGLLQEILERNDAWGDTIYLGPSNTGKDSIYAYYYNRNGTDKAMVMAGVHGSEFYGVDVVDSLKARLDTMTNISYKWKIILLPSLFAENVSFGRSLPFYENKGRETCKGCTDPNRQMPKDNLLYESGVISALGEKIETENQYLLQLVQAYTPSRIASIHCKNEGRKNEIGIYADPRTDTNRIALGFAKDAALAIEMAIVTKDNGGRIIGNSDSDIRKGYDAKYTYIFYNAIYPQDSLAVMKSGNQYRSFQDKVSGTYKGVSFGTWASTRIYKNGQLKKDAATTLTIELPQFYSFADSKNKKYPITTNTNAYVKSLVEVFLSNQ